jgi:hypothetical protein
VLGVVMKKKKRRTLNAAVDDEQNLLDAFIEYGARKSEEREFVLWQYAERCCEGFCVNHFLFKGSLSHAIRVSVHVEQTRHEKRESS